jgi:hypothetical protein
MYNNDSNPVLYIVIMAVVALVLLGITRCENALADADLQKVSPTAKSDYQAYNTETWFEQKVKGGNRMKKAVYATYTSIAKENGITVYDAVRESRGRFAGQFRNKFRTLSSFLSLPDVRNAYRTESFGTPAVIVHFTWEECSGSGDDRHCHTEHDEVTIPEVNIPEREVEYDGNVDIDYEGFDMVVN